MSKLGVGQKNQTNRTETDSNQTKVYSNHLVEDSPIRMVQFGFKPNRTENPMYFVII